MYRDSLPGDTPVLFGQYGTGHRPTWAGPACGSRERTVTTRVVNCLGHGYPPCTDTACWGGGRPW